VADAEERARRRLLEEGVDDLSPGAVRAEAERLRARDQLDSARAVAPLVRAADAVEIDTTGLDFQEQVDAVVRLARARGGT
jgi:CMP/dCMP kinase